jgi:hypothetical protein
MINISRISLSYKKVQQYKNQDIAKCDIKLFTGSTPVNIHFILFKIFPNSVLDVCHSEASQEVLDLLAQFSDSF